MKNTPMPLDLIFIGQDGTIARSSRASRCRRRSSRPASRCASCSNSRRAPPQQGRYRGWRQVRHPAIDQAPGCSRSRSRISSGSADAVLPHEGFDLAYIDREPAAGTGDPVLLIHGFASSHSVNWVSPGLGEDAERCRLPGDRLRQSRSWPSSKSYDPADYTPGRMAGDAAALLAPSRHRARSRHGLFDGRAHLGLSGACRAGNWSATLVFGGLGIGMVDGVGDWDPIADGTACRRSRRPSAIRAVASFRTFADQTRSDRRALAACIETSRELLTEDEVARITQPTLIAVGTKDDIGGSPDALAGLMPNATAFDIEGRDHMLAVGDRDLQEARPANFSPRIHCKCCAESCARSGETCRTVEGAPPRVCLPLSWGERTSHSIRP